jgi:hypothetical protein
MPSVIVMVMRTEVSACWLHIVLIMPVGGSASSSLSSTVTIFTNDNYFEELIEIRIVYVFLSCRSRPWGLLSL